MKTYNSDVISNSAIPSSFDSAFTVILPFLYPAFNKMNAIPASAATGYNHQGAAIHQELIDYLAEF